MSANSTPAPRPRFAPSRKLLAVAVLALLGVGAYLAGTFASPPVNYGDPALIAAGAEKFAANCALCHGRKAVGENSASKMGGRKPGGSYWAPALNGTAHAWHHPPDGLFNVIKQGSPAKDSPMRGWKQTLSDREIHGLIAYLQSLWPKKVRERYHQAFSAQ